MPDEITSKVRLFADDTIMYLAIMNDSDTTKLHRDLDKLAEWETKWQMLFHPGKCQVLIITRNHTIIQHHYILHGHVLEHVKEAKYLGVTLTSDLQWNRHIANVSTKANRTWASYDEICRSTPLWWKTLHTTHLYPRWWNSHQQYGTPTLWVTYARWRKSNVEPPGMCWTGFITTQVWERWWLN